MPRELGVLVVLAGLYCLASASEVLLVKGLNQQTVEFPVLTSALLNGYWPLQLAMYFLLLCRADDPRYLTWPILRGYLVVGFIATGVSLLRCYGLNGLPGSTYVVISCSDIIFNTLLSRLLLKKKFSVYHYAAVGITVFGILLLALSADSPHPAAAAAASAPREALPAPPPAVGRGAAIAAALASALLSAINSVLGEFLLSKDKANPLLAVSEVSFFNAFVPSLCLPFAMFQTGEVWLYHDKYSELAAHDDWAGGAANGSDVVGIVAWLALGLALSKMIDRICKFYIISLSGAFFFAILDTFRRMATGLIAVYAFGEAFDISKLLALALTCVAIGVYSLGNLREAQKKSAAASQDTALLSQPGGEAAAAPGEDVPGVLSDWNFRASTVWTAWSGEGEAPPPNAGAAETAGLAQLFSLTGVSRATRAPAATAQDLSSVADYELAVSSVLGDGIPSMEMRFRGGAASEGPLLNSLRASVWATEAAGDSGRSSLHHSLAQ